MPTVVQKHNNKEYEYEVDYSEVYRKKYQKRRQIVIELDIDTFEKFSNKLAEDGTNKSAFIKSKIKEYLGS